MLVINTSLLYGTGCVMYSSVTQEALRGSGCAAGRGPAGSRGRGALGVEEAVAAVEKSEARWAGKIEGRLRSPVDGLLHDSSRLT